MITETIVINKIIADEGKILTNGEIYGKEIFLGSNSATEDYYEITEEEYKKVKAKEEKQAQAENGE